VIVEGNWIFVVDDDEHIVAMAWPLSSDPAYDDWRIRITASGQRFTVDSAAAAKIVMDLLQNGMTHTDDYDGREDPETCVPLPAGVDGLAVGAGAGRKAEEIASV